MTDPHDVDEASKYLNEAQTCYIPSSGEVKDMSVQELEGMKETMQEQGSQIRALTLGADKNIVAQVIYIMRSRDIPWWSKPTLIRVVRNQQKTSRFQRRMKERALQGRYKIKKWGFDFDFTTEDVQRIMNTLGKIIIGVTGGTTAIFTLQELFGNIIRSGAVSKLFERALGL